MFTDENADEKSNNNEMLIQSITSKGANCYLDFPLHKISTYLIIEAAKKRGMKVVLHEEQIFELIGHGKSVLFRQNAPENSIIATAIATKKNLTKNVLAKKGLPIAQGEIFNRYEKAVQYFFKKTTPQVVKPNTGSHGRGITTNITKVADFEKAWLLAHQNKNLVIVEDFITGNDIRILVIGGKARAAYVHIPAYVIGNGTDNIQMLVDEKNKIRLQNPALQRALIKRFDLLEANGLDFNFIPTTGEKIQLTSVSNISDGGESIEIFDSIHPSIIEIAEQATCAIPGMNVAGLDFVIENFTQPVSHDNIAIILEVNGNPEIDEHIYPSFGKSVDLPGILIDFILQDERIGRKDKYPGGKITAPVDYPEYLQTGNGLAFSRNHSIQRELIKQAGYHNNLIISEISNCIFKLSSKSQEVVFLNGMPDSTIYVSSKASNKKNWTKRLLKASGIITPHGKSFAVDKRENAWRFAEKLGRPVVVKPQTGSGSRGVSVNISTSDHFNLAWDLACNTDNKIIVVEEYLLSKSYRLFVVGDHVPAAAQRIPAYIIGNGIYTVQQLIDEKNNQRVSNPYLGAKLIKISPTVNFNLTHQGITAESILKKDQYLQLQPVSSISSGGESVDVSEVVHPGFVNIAITSRKALFEPVYAGVDILAEDISKSPDKQAWMVTGVDVNPDIALHHFPSSGIPRDAAGALVSHLFSEISADKTVPKKMTKVLITGKVHGVGFRKWIWRNAHLHSISGWVQNNPDGTLEALFCGPPNAVDHLIGICRKGPKRAAVENLTLLSFERDVPFGFVINGTAD